MEPRPRRQPDASASSVTTVAAATAQGSHGFQPGVRRSSTKAHPPVTAIATASTRLHQPERLCAWYKATAPMPVSAAIGGAIALT